jgi:hypothetical protein
MNDGVESIGRSTDRDNQVLESRIDYFKMGNQPIEEILQNFPTFTRRITITRFLAHYELFRQIQNIPGSIVELGVFKGASLFAFAHFLEIFCHGDRSRKVIGFDSFQGLTNFAPEDGSFSQQDFKQTGGWKAESFDKDLERLIDLFQMEAFVPQAKRLQLIKGDINTTVPLFVSQNPGLRISLLHFDCDLFEPTLTGLKHLVPLMVPGGLIVFDEYAITAWAGESKALEQYFGREVKIEKFTWTTLPGGYIRV